jgi:hypothetical protein
MDNEIRLLEVKQILKYKEEVNNTERIKKYYEKYKKELDGFKYIENENYFNNKNKFYVRYIGFNNKLYYGGFFVKAEKKNNTIYIYLINTKKKIWNIDFNKNFVFVNKIISEDDKIRKSFIEFLEKQSYNN